MEVTEIVEAPPNHLVLVVLHRPHPRQLLEQRSLFVSFLHVKAHVAICRLELSEKSLEVSALPALALAMEAMVGQQAAAREDHTEESQELVLRVE